MNRRDYLTVMAAAGATIAIPRAVLAKDVITIGAILPLTGTGAVYGHRMQQGIEMGLAAVNNRGDLGNREIKVVYADTGDQPSNGPTALRRFKQLNDIPYSLISNSNVILATLPVAAELKVVLLNGGGQSDKLVGASPWLFSNIPASQYEVSDLAAYAAKNIGKSSIVTYQTDPVGQSQLAGWRKSYVAAGGTILEEEAVNLEQTDYRSVLTKMRPQGEKAQCWFIAGTYGEDAKRLITQARILGLNAQIVSTGLTVATFETISPQIAQGVIHTQLKGHATATFISAFKKRFGAEPEFYNIAYYNGVTIFAQALANALKRSDGTGGDAIRRSIDQLKTFDSPAGRTEFDDQNSTVSGLEIVQLQADETRKTLSAK